MKLLKFKTISGYKMLEKGFEVSFLTKTRVDSSADNNDLIELEPGLFYPLETVFIGKNSSGKTSVLLLIQLIMEFVRTGRISTGFMADQKDFELEFSFYDKGYIYFYEGKFYKDDLKNKNYLLIKNESLRKTTYKSNYKKDLSNIFFPKENLIEPNIDSDTSGIIKFKFNDTSILIDLILNDNANLASIIETIKKIIWR